MAQKPLKKGKYPVGEGRPVKAGSGGGITPSQTVQRPPGGLSAGAGRKPFGIASTGTQTPKGPTVSKGVEKQLPKAAEVKSGFQKRFQKLDRPERHKLVEKVMAKKFGKTDWRQKIYGKDYKAGTVKGINKEVKEGHAKGKRITGYLKEAQANLAKSAGNTENKSKVESRIKELGEARKKSNTVIEQKKEKRQTYLDRRNKALGNIQATAKRNPAALKAGRKRLAEQKIKENQKATDRGKKKKGQTTKSGGTQAA